MIKQTYKNKNRNKTTEKQALLAEQAKTETPVQTVSGVSSLRAGLAANLPRRSTSRSSARNSSLRKIWTWPLATAERTRPGLSPHSSPETKTLLSMTALTLAALRPHRVNLA
jgi:hypothetical protein